MEGVASNSNLTSSSLSSRPLHSINAAASRFNFGTGGLSVGSQNSYIRSISGGAFSSDADVRFEITTDNDDVIYLIHIHFT